MNTVTRSFVNELGNQIKITIEGPTSISENTLTPVEAANLSEAMLEAAPLAWRYRHRDWEPGSPWALSNKYPREHAGMGGRLVEPLGPFAPRTSSALVMALQAYIEGQSPNAVSGGQRNSDLRAALRSALTPIEGV